ncbi:ParA family protein [Nitrospirillum pindoramense]|uniref:AAA domain-containing protein n=1 Tax=Nitrospirillum amazonense TaxID=28077 RepID=A0A560HG66_9PROT|nr:AAA family ATPase [Nitrospirillum amazonense]TWB45428.1 AAA domain-containing protein [Nitrospirillum amazonense]
MTTIAFFNNKGGVGKTSLVYHLAWMFAELGQKVVVADLDPQANLTSMFLSEERQEQLWAPGDDRQTIWSSVKPLYRNTGDIAGPFLEPISDRIRLIAGDLALSRFEDKLSQAWMNSADGDEGALRTVSSFGRIIKRTAEQTAAGVTLIDVGPNLGAINRAALIAADYVIVPLSPDLFSLQGLRNLGPTLREWRSGWLRRRDRLDAPGLWLPDGKIEPAGYILMRHSVRLDRAVKAFDRWMRKVPGAYRVDLLQEEAADPNLTSEVDPYCLGRLKDYRSLMAMAQEVNKPMFALRPADGAIGGHQAAVIGCYQDFKALAEKIAERCDIEVWDPLGDLLA